jgi:hypothetical protein
MMFDMGEENKVNKMESCLHTLHLRPCCQTTFASFSSRLATTPEGSIERQ